MKRMLFFFSLIYSQNLLSQNVGIGTTTPLSKLHIAQGFSGNTAPFSPLVVEGSGHTYINLLAPNINETAILFGKPTHAASGGIVYNNFSTPNGFQFRTFNNTVKMVLNENGHVGIGNPNPEFMLDVRGRIRLGTDFLSSAGIWLNNADNTATQAFFGIEDNSYAGIYASPGWSFGVNTSTGNVKIMGRLGIGTTSPTAPLTFPAALGKKITLYPGATGDVGFAVAGNRLQIYSDNPNADVAIGYDAAGIFNERFAIKPNGSLAINGSTGAAGLMLQSNGSGPASWASSTNTLYNNVGMATSSSLFEISQAMPLTPIPGYSYTFSVAGNAKVLVNFNVHIAANICGFCAESTVYIEMYVNGGSAAIYTLDITNGATELASGQQLLSVGPGTYTIQLLGKVFGPNVQFYPHSQFLTNNMIVQVIPQ